MLMGQVYHIFQFMLAQMGFLVLLYGPRTQQSESEFHGEHRNNRLERTHVARKDPFDERKHHGKQT